MELLFIHNFGSEAVIADSFPIAVAIPKSLKVSPRKLRESRTVLPRNTGQIGERKDETDEIKSESSHFLYRNQRATTTERCTRARNSMEEMGTVSQRKAVGDRA